MHQVARVVAIFFKLRIFRFWQYRGDLEIREVANPHMIINLTAFPTRVWYSHESSYSKTSSTISFDIYFFF